ncbi:endosulfine alpha b isoform X2 [Nelusetta ayraudi]|uniref:endosulfine alpha b isoform X2 n=1 Tax=Nelusetta ayraudi TaxID=303726 RepID=UPI003F72ACD2
MSSENLDSDTQVDYEDEKQDSQEKNASPVQAEEAKMKARYPCMTMKPGGPEFLTKMLHRGAGHFSTSTQRRRRLPMVFAPLPEPEAEPLKLTLRGDRGTS